MKEGQIDDHPVVVLVLLGLGVPRLPEVVAKSQRRCCCHMGWSYHREDESIGVRHVFHAAEPLQSFLHRTAIDVRPIHGHSDGRNVGHVEHGDTEEKAAKKNVDITV